MLGRLLLLLLFFVVLLLFLFFLILLCFRACFFRLLYRFLRFVFVVATRLASELCDIFFEFRSLFPVKRSRVCLHLRIYPTLIYIFVCNKILYFLATSALSRLLIIGWKSSLPVRIYYVVAHILIHFYHFWLPFVQINRLYLCYMNLKLSMHP